VDFNPARDDYPQAGISMRLWISKSRDTFIAIIWAIFFFTLPVTSFPFFPSGVGGKTLVRPLAIYPLIIIFALVIIPRLFTRKLPATLLPLLAFAVIALISSIAAFSFDLESIRGITLSSRFIRNIATLGMGIAFYLTTTLLNDSWDGLKFSLRWIYTGFSVALFWGSLQAINVVFYTPAYFKLLNHLQSFVSTRKLFTTRISGLTFEPKWFAEQICILLLPWLMSSILAGKTVFPWRRKWLTVELFLCIWSIVVLVFTYSRTGLTILGLLVVVCFLIFRSRRDSVTRRSKFLGRRTWFILEILLLTVSLLAVFFVVGSQNPYFSRFWRYFTEARQRNRTYLEYIAFQQRFVYLETALNIFAAYPVFGVGLGNYAFFFDQMLPVRIYSQPEVIRQSTPTEESDSLITPKNLIARILAETGLLGAITFIGYLMAVVGCAVVLCLGDSAEQRFWGIGGVLALIVFSIMIFTFDSFAIPNMWVVFGLITAAAHMEKTSSLPVEGLASNPIG
jgi:hypothetical protein